MADDPLKLPPYTRTPAPLSLAPRPAEMRSFEPGPSDRLASAIQDGLMALGMQPYSAGHLGRGFRDVISASPLGVPLGLAELENATRKGDTFGTLAALPAMVPGARAGKLAMDEAARMARAAEQGFTGPWYHGSWRTDRLTESGKINPKRATSGPMPFFTDNPEMASSYAMGKKADTSLLDNGMIQEYFTVSPKDLGWGGRTDIPVERTFQFLPREVQQTILDRARRVGHQDLDLASGPLVLHPPGVDATQAGDHFNYIMRTEARGNPLHALRELWHDSGRLVDNPGELANVFRLAGYPYPISEKNAPWTEARGVMPAMLALRRPLVTDSEEVMRALPQLEEAFKRDRTRLQQFGADQWDKNTRWTPRDWVAQAREDYAKGPGSESFVWTSIPDKVTDQFRRLGYDSILDVGGKMGGAQHTVAIPFSPDQVRSAFARFDPNKAGTGLVLGSGAGLTFGSLAAGGDNVGY